MARKRMIDPNFWQSEDISKLSILARLLFIGMFSNADDEGRGRAKAAYLKSIIFPYDEVLRVADVDKALNEIALNTSTTFYLHDGNEYYELINWSDWQRVEKPQKSQIPAKNSNSPIIRRTFPDCSPAVPRRVADESPNVPRRVPPSIREEKRREENISEDKSSSCSEPQVTPSQKAPETIIDLPLCDKTDFSVTAGDIQTWADLYPAVDVLQELRAMKGWLLANPTKRKTRGGIMRFVNSWLSREQDKGGLSPPGKPTPEKEGKTQGAAILEAAQWFRDREAQ